MRQIIKGNNVTLGLIVQQLFFDITQETAKKQYLNTTGTSSFLVSTAQLRPWPPPQNRTEFLGGFSTIFFFTGYGC
jgi:hypothetical protein